MQSGVIGRRIMGGVLTCAGVSILYLLQLIVVFLVPAIGGRLVHVSMYYPWVDSLLRLMPAVATLAIALYAPQGKPLILKAVGLQLVSRSSGAVPGIKQRIVRWVLLAATAMLFGLPLVAMLIRTDGRAIHDVLSGTDVIRSAE